MLNRVFVAALAAWVATGGLAFAGGPISTQGLPGSTPYQATGGNAAINSGARFGLQLNVLDFNADASGATDSSAAFIAAAAAQTQGSIRDVQVPAGSYLISNPITVGSTTSSQCFVGQGWSSQIIVGPGFNTSALGVFLPTPNTASNVQPCIKNMRITFQQPNDLTTTSTGTNISGQNTINLASVAGITTGMVVNDATDPNAVPNTSNNKQLATPTVTLIVGNTITISVNLSGTISAGHVIAFAQPRANFKTLSQGCSTTPGSAYCKYPWAVYSASQTNDVLLDNVIIESAWNGVYIRGSTFHIGSLKVGALNVGLDIDNCYNFPQIGDYLFWAFGINQTNNQAALSILYYDGNNIAANLGRTDGLAADSLQTWAGQIILTSTWTFGSIRQLMLDGANADISILSAANKGFVLISNMYSSKPAQTYGAPVYINPVSTFLTDISNINIISASPYNSAFVAVNGLTILSSGVMSDIQQANIPMIKLQGGQLKLSNLSLDANPSRTDTYITQTGGVLQMGSNIDFTTAPGTGGTGLSVTGAGTNQMITTSTIAWNGWAHP